MQYNLLPGMEARMGRFICWSPHEPKSTSPGCFPFWRGAPDRDRRRCTDAAYCVVLRPEKESFLPNSFAYPIWARPMVSHTPSGPTRWLLILRSEHSGSLRTPVMLAYCREGYVNGASRYPGIPQDFSERPQSHPNQAPSIFSPGWKPGNPSQRICSSERTNGRMRR